MSQKLPVIIAGTNCLSGVTSWADQLRDAMADHPRYDVRTLYVGPDPEAPADFVARTSDEAHALVLENAPAILIPNYIWPLYFAAFEAGVRCLGMCHADNDTQYYRPLCWYEPLITRYIAVSQECSQRLGEYLPCRAGEIDTLPYGISLPSQLERDYHTKPLRLIYAGRVTQPQKRVWDFVPLVEQLLRAKVPFIFDVFGEGDEFTPLQQMFAARIPAADVRFHHRIPHREMAAQWLGHDIFLQVSDFEGTSVSMLEAMAHGAVPVVTAASSGIAGVINQGENGFVVPVGDMTAMAKTIARLAADPVLLHDVGRGAYRTAQLYAMEQYVRKFERILDRVATAEQNVDYVKRYGIYTPPHPLLLQQQTIWRQQQQLQQELDRRSHRALQRLFSGGLKSLRRSKSRAAANDDKRAA